MPPERYDDGVDTDAQRLIWLPPGSTVVTVMGQIDPDETFRPAPPRIDPAKVWTLDGLMCSILPPLPLPRNGSQLQVLLQRVAGGSWMMAAHEHVLYLSQRVLGRPPTPADFAHARQLGYAGSSPALLLSWQEAHR